jgi:predicted PurR-regulated permease PerM
MQVSAFTRDLGNVGEKINSYLTDLDSFLITGVGLESGFSTGLNQTTIIDFIQSNSTNLPEFFFNALGSLASIILLPVFIFFFLVYRDHLTDFIVIMFKEHKKKLIKSEILALSKVIQKYIIGIFKVMAVLAVLNAALLFGLGIKHAIFFAVFAAFLNIIPYLGPILGGILPTIFAILTKDSLFYPIGVIIGFMIIQMIESNFLTPKIVGGTVNLNAFITLLGLLVGAAIWGVIGMILIIPTLAVLRKIFQLNESTKPYAFLLGEEKNKENLDPLLV